MIKNRNQLVSHGFTEGREILLNIAKDAIGSVNSYRLTTEQVRVKNNNLLIADLSYDLSKIENIFVIGGGKATFPIAQALEDILGTRITYGVVIIKNSEEKSLDNIKVIKGSHPIPNKQGLKGTEEILAIANQATEDDLVFCAITGGASALLTKPAVDFKDFKKMNKLLLSSGASIEDINTVRKHISQIKGGKITRDLHPAQTISLILIDEIANEPWGPTVADPTTFDDAIEVLKKYSLWEVTPKSVVEYLQSGKENPRLETLKPQEFHRLKVKNVILGNNQMMCQAAKERAEKLGCKSMILTSVLEGESKDAGIALACIAKEIKDTSRPISPPCCLIMGGETTVQIEDPKQFGKGGPSQEFVLGASLKIQDNKNIAVLSMDSDGTDGPTDIAGGIVDGSTINRAREKELNLYENLINHNSSWVLQDLQDAIYTGPTGTNVMNLYLAVILS